MDRIVDPKKIYTLMLSIKTLKIMTLSVIGKIAAFSRTFLATVLIVIILRAVMLNHFGWANCPFV
jgi:hypothetical protein